MNHNLEIQRLLIKRDEAPLPNDRINLLKQAIAIADTHNDLQWGFDLRVELIDEESNTSCCVESFPAFAWVIDAYDSQPDLFNVDYLIGKYRWMINQSFCNVNIPLKQIATIVNDFKKRLQNNGYSLRTYYSAKADWGFMVGDSEIVRQNLLARNDEEPNRLFDYWMGELYADIEFSLRTKQFEEAEQMMRSLTEADLNENIHYPLAMYASFVKYYTNAGKLELAHNYFLKADECLSRINNDTSPVTSVGKLIRFLSIYNPNEAWRYFEKHINWTVDCEDSTLVYFAIDVLNLLKKKQNKTLKVSPRLAWYKLDDQYNTADLFAYYYDIAQNLARQFDERNGTPSTTNRLNEVMRNKNRLLAWWQKLWSMFKK